MILAYWPLPVHHFRGRSFHCRSDGGRCRERWGHCRKFPGCRCHGERPEWVIEFTIIEFYYLYNRDSIEILVYIFNQPSSVTWQYMKIIILLKIIGLLVSDRICMPWIESSHPVNDEDFTGTEFLLELLSSDRHRVEETKTPKRQKEIKWGLPH